VTLVSFSSYGSYSGPRIRGKKSLDLRRDSSHMDRVLWLTSKVESGGNFGAVMAYDGTGMTAGLHQAIAVYPKELADDDLNAADDQGSLFALLASLPSDTTTALRALFASEGWLLVGEDLRYADDTVVHIGDVTVRAKRNSLVYGDHIRDVFTPVDGKVPRSGPRWEESKRWAVAFHEVFSNPKTFDAQIAFGVEHFNNTARRKKLSVAGRTATLSEWLYGGSPLSMEADLAIAVFWSHSVNGPSVAYRILTSVLEKDPTPSQGFASRLLRDLAHSTYGRWNFSVRSGRWSRTRLAAKASGLWPKEFFEPTGIMPETFE
jgi:hypothetical protein